VEGASQLRHVKPPPTRARRSTSAAPGRSAGPVRACSRNRVRSGKIVWEKHWPELCYSGSRRTPATRVVGRNSGVLLAARRRTAQLWSFQTGAGAHTATVFQRDGREQIAFYGAGTRSPGSAHGDNLWLSARRKARPRRRWHGGHADHACRRGQATGFYRFRRSSDRRRRQASFADNCSTCHGALGRGGNGGPDLGRSRMRRRSDV